VRVSLRHVELSLRHRFTLSRSSDDVRHSVLLRIEHEELTGLGEAAPSRRYGESAEGASAFLRGLDLSRFEDPFRLDEILLAVAEKSADNNAAKAALDMALHDWIGKKLRLPLWKYWGLDRAKSPRTSYTIGIDSPQIVAKKVREADPFPLLKVKLGVPSDREIVQAIREVTSKPITVDANEGWKSKEEALDQILWLEERGIEFVEQPLSAKDLDGTAWLRERVHVPLFADESITGLKDLQRLKGVFDGINIKLMKCGGLKEAMNLIGEARATGMKILLGCMIETSLGISAAAQLSPLADYADLDGNLLISNDPFTGVTVHDGKLILNDLPGLGVSESAAAR
jgi:L-alanine-DL-glutamate epimerase-like enolase superfamily enzyme